MRSTNEIPSNRNITEQPSEVFSVTNEQPQPAGQDTVEQFSVDDFFSKVRSGQPISDEVMRAIDEANRKVIELARQVRA